MRRPWFETGPVDESFFESAPLRLRKVFEIQWPATAVWAELTSESPLAWLRILEGINWTSSPPHGVGATRTARSHGELFVIHEYFFRWEEGRRHSFYVTEASVPLFRHFAEDYLVEPTSEGSCRFTWTIAVEPRPAARIATPLNRLLLNSLFRDTRGHYSRPFSG